MHQTYAPTPTHEERQENQIQVKQSMKTMDVLKLAAAMLLLCTYALADATATTTTNPSNSAQQRVPKSPTSAGANPSSNPAPNLAQQRVPKSQRCTFNRALCVANCTDGSGPGKPDPPQDEECNKSCAKQIACRPDGTSEIDYAEKMVNPGDQFGDEKSFFGKKLLCSFKRAFCLVSCSGGSRRSPDPEMPQLPAFKPSCMTSCSKDVLCH